ncbi:MAG: hypothetical protein H7062_20370, partial [Candidatus Saccharimonas sp.]|nr:hypothetical protein [Planctomycetaceae bacterium]
MSVPPPASAPVPPVASTSVATSKVNYRELRPQKIVDTAAQLERRIADRFPGAGLRQVAGELHRVAQEAVLRCEQIKRPHVWLRAACVVLVAAILGVIVLLGLNVHSNGDELKQLDNFAQTVEATLGSLFFIGATLAFLFSLERRLKRERALSALHELRAIAHIVDMHQLTKDPENLLHGARTPSSPPRTLTAFELGRYLDYCSELLSIVSKIGAIYVQEFPDADAVEAADQLAALTNGLSRTIWQKIMILDRTVEPGGKNAA